MIISIVKKGFNLIAAFDSDSEKLAKLKPNEIYQCEIKQPRNAKLHRKFFALINMIFENQEIYNSKDRLRKDLLIESGYYIEWVDFKGVQRIEAKSISFAKINTFDFEILYNRVLNQIVKHFNFDKEKIIENVNKYY